MDTVFLRGLSVLGKHGVMERERHVEQEFVIDIATQVDTKRAAESDALADAVDYVRFRDIAVDIVTKESHFLIERLAERIAIGIMEDPRIQSISISIKKPAVLQSGVPGITIVRHRQ